jgi:hypothetical protein
MTSFTPNFGEIRAKGSHTRPIKFLLQRYPFDSNPSTDDGVIKPHIRQGRGQGALARYLLLRSDGSV